MKSHRGRKAAAVPLHGGQQQSFFGMLLAKDILAASKGYFSESTLLISRVRVKPSADEMRRLSASHILRIRPGTGTIQGRLVGLTVSELKGLGKMTSGRPLKYRRLGPGHEK